MATNSGQKNLRKRSRSTESNEPRDKSSKLDKVAGWSTDSSPYAIDKTLYIQNIIPEKVSNEKKTNRDSTFIKSVDISPIKPMKAMDHELSPLQPDVINKNLKLKINSTQINDTKMINQDLEYTNLDDSILNIVQINSELISPSTDPGILLASLENNSSLSLTNSISASTTRSLSKK